jgi:hypothetical protein
MVFVIVCLPTSAFNKSAQNFYFCGFLIKVLSSQKIILRGFNKNLELKLFLGTFIKSIKRVKPYFWALFLKSA